MASSDPQPLASQQLGGSQARAAELPIEPEWEEVAAALPALIAAAPPGLQRFPGTDSGWSNTAAICAALWRDGAVILERAASESACDAVISQMAPYVEAAGFGDGFLGRATRRAGACVSRSAASRQLIQHPLLLKLCGGVLGRQLLHLCARPSSLDSQGPRAG